MNRKELIRQLDLDLAQHRGLLSREEEQRYIEMVAEGYDAPDPEEGQEEEPLPVELIRWHKILRLKARDASPEVNSFILGGQSTWIDPYRRANYYRAIEAKKKKGDQTVALDQIELPIDMAAAALDAIEAYAADCKTATDRHEDAIRQLRTAEEIEAYDITTGYPEKLSF
ncbi:MAG: hypothetical protein K6G79_07280 [Bacteroidales bacterium]|nr:hypothetical protein [Bacteroidales bacterium]